MPASGMRDMNEALRRARVATGLSFHNMGTTHRKLDAAYRGPDGGFVIGWETPAEMGGLSSGNEFGTTQDRFQGVDAQHLTIVSSFVVINVVAVAKAKLPAGFGPGLTQGFVYVHELGHLVGLNHTTGKAQIANPFDRPRPMTTWGARDIAGLKAVGKSAGCLPRNY